MIKAIPTKNTNIKIAKVKNYNVMRFVLNAHSISDDYNILVVTIEEDGSLYFGTGATNTISIINTYYRGYRTIPHNPNK